MTSTRGTAVPTTGRPGFVRAPIATPVERAVVAAPVAVARGAAFACELPRRTALPRLAVPWLDP
jgi:hypothetical protein